MRFAGLAVFVLLGCGTSGSAAPDAGGPGAASDAGHDGALEGDAATAPSDTGGALSFDGAPKDCSSPGLPPPNGAAGPPLDGYCAGTASNAPTCPSTVPGSGGSCTPSGLFCAYREDAVLHWSSCHDGTWTAGQNACSSTCTVTSGDAEPITAACGSAAPIECAVNANLTDVERATQSFRAIIECCGGIYENAIDAQLVDGCVMSLRILAPSRVTDSFRTCVRNAVAGRRFACLTKDASCIGVVESTLP